MKFLMTAVLLTLTLNSWADLPRIDAPQELTTGDFAEGTVTQLTENEVAEFLPWAQNAHNQLNRALQNSRSLPLRDRRPLLERAIRSVVMKSGDRQYQMFMRFSLNRGLLLVSEMEKFMNMEEIGAQENALDILQRSIQIALSFYESDLSFQRRSQNGSTSTELSYARFASTFMSSMYQGVVNIFDSQAQYRLLYKLIEMVNWDLSRDAHALNYAESIVEAYEALTDLPELPLSDSKANLRLIRRLNMLRILSVQYAQNRGETNIPSRDIGTPRTPSTPTPLPSQHGGYATFAYSASNSDRYCYKIDLNDQRIGSNSAIVDESYCHSGYATFAYSASNSDRYCYKIDREGRRIGPNGNIVDESNCHAGYKTFAYSSSNSDRYCYKIDSDGRRIGANSNIADTSNCHSGYATFAYSASNSDRYCYKTDAEGRRIGSNSNIEKDEFCHSSYAMFAYSASNSDRYCYKIDDRGRRIGSNSNMVNNSFCGY